MIACQSAPAETNRGRSNADQSLFHCSIAHASSLRKFPTAIAIGKLTSENQRAKLSAILF